MSSLLDDLKALRPKYDLIQSKWWRTGEDGHITGTCPLTALAMSKGLISERELYLGGVTGSHICDLLSPHYGHSRINEVFMVWDELEDPTLEALVEALQNES